MAKRFPDIVGELLLWLKSCPDLTDADIDGMQLHLIVPDDRACYYVTRKIMHETQPREIEVYQHSPRKFPIKMVGIPVVIGYKSEGL